MLLFFLFNSIAPTMMMKTAAAATTMIAIS